MAFIAIFGGAAWTHLHAATCSHTCTSKDHPRASVSLASPWPCSPFFGHLTTVGCPHICFRDALPQSIRTGPTSQSFRFMSMFLPASHQLQDPSLHLLPKLSQSLAGAIVTISVIHFTCGLNVAAGTSCGTLSMLLKFTRHFPGKRKHLRLSSKNKVDEWCVYNLNSQHIGVVSWRRGHRTVFSRIFMKHIGSAGCISISVSCEVLFVLDLFPGMSQWCLVSWIDPHFCKCFSAPSKLTKCVER